MGRSLRGLFAGAVAWALLHSAPARAADAAPLYRHAVRLHIDGPIMHGAVAQFRRHLEAARAADADLVVVEIDSPGGLADASFEIAHLLRDLQWARTVAYVPRQAYSGGAIVALGCADLVLGPRAMFGDIGPIVLGDDGAFRHAEEKAVSAIAQELRTLAEARHRPGGLAEAFADRNLKVYRTPTADGKGMRSVSERELAAQPLAPGARKELIPETGNGRFLTLDGRRTVELGFGTFACDNFPEALDRLGGAARETDLVRTWVDGLIDTLNHPLCTVLLIAVGLACLYGEVAVAGMGLLWIPATLCFALFFWSKILGGTVGWLALAMFVVGLACLAVEIFVTPGVGVAGLTGILLTILGLVIAVQGFVVPSTSADWSQVGSTLGQVGAGGILFLGAAGFASKHLEKVPLFRSLILAPTAADPASPEARGELTGAEPLATFLGQTGVAATDLRPAGKVRIGTRMLDVVADGFFIPAHAPVEVLEVAGNRVVVRKV